MYFSKFGNGHQVVVFPDLRTKLVHLGNDLETQNQGQDGNGRGADGLNGSDCCGIADGSCSGHHNGKFEIGDVERPNELGVHGVVVLQNEQGNGAKQKIGGHRQHGNRENQGNLVGGQHF